MNKYAVVNILFILGTVLILFLLNEFEKVDSVKTYAIPILYASYLAGRLSVKLVNTDKEKREMKLIRSADS